MHVLLVLAAGLMITRAASAAYLAHAPWQAPAAVMEEEPAPSYTAEVLAVRITRALPEPLRNVQVVSQFFAQGRGTGVQILAVLRPMEGRIVEAEGRELRIDAFLDDTHQDLRPGADFRDRSHLPVAGIAADGSAAVVLLSTDRTPAESAERLLVRGSIRLKSASEQKETAKLELPLRIGGTLDVGGAELRVTSLSSIAGGRDGVSITFQSRQPIEGISRVLAFDEHDRPLSAMMTNRTIGRDSAPSQMIVAIHDPAETVRLQFTYSDRVREELVPFEVQVDLGIARIAEPAAGLGLTGEDPAPQDEDERPHEVPQPGQEEAASPDDDAVAAMRRGARRLIDWGGLRAPQVPRRQAPGWPEPGEEPEAVDPEPPFVETAQVEVLGVAASRLPGDSGMLPLERGQQVRMGPAGVEVSPASAWPVHPVALFKPFGGTQLQLLIQVPGERIVGVDVAGLKISSFTDDTGATLSTDLALSGAGAPPPLSLPGAGPPERSAPPEAAVIMRHDREQALLRFGMEASPARGASAVRIRGSVPVLLSGAQRSIQAPGVSLQPGAELAPEDADFSMKINSIHISWPGSAPPPVAGPVAPVAGGRLLVTLQSDLPPERLRAMSMVTPSGDSVPVSLEPQRRHPSAPEPTTYIYRFTIPDHVDVADVHWTILDEARRRMLPLDVTASLGV